ncbi:MAG: hypothetical protein M1444_03760 [Patescibacteria group bacterium]|nr:hypothetical protein [Patescibacteria group bacterium]
MSVIANILITLVFFFVLMYLSVNLLGLFVRGLFPKLEIERVKKEGLPEIKNDIEDYRKKQPWITFFALILNIVFFYILYYFWNIGVVIVAIMLMSGRLPDLIWEIKHGRKIDPKTMPKNTLNYVSTLLLWGALPVLYYFLYLLK